MSASAASAPGAAAMLLVWTDIPAEAEEAFNDWYNREHMRERIEVPGFVRGRRFETHACGPRYLALYEAAHVDVLRSDRYLNLKRQRDAASLRFTSQFRNAIKATCEVRIRAGTGEGAFLVVWPLAVQAEARAGFCRWMATALPDALQAPGMVAGAFAEHSDAVREVNAAYDVRDTDRHLQSVLLLEAASERSAHAACKAFDAQVLGRQGAMIELLAAPCVLRVLYTLHH